MVFILTGSFPKDKEGASSMSVSVLKKMCEKQQQQINMLNEKLKKSEQKLQKIEEETEEI